MSYNLSLINGSGIVPLLTTVNEELMFGWYGRFGLITLFIILSIAFIVRTNNTAKSLTFASLITALSSVLFRTIGLIIDTDMMITWVIAAILMGYSVLSQE